MASGIVNVKVVGRSVLWEGSYLRAVLLMYVDPLGEAGRWEAVERRGCDGIAVVVPVTGLREVLLVRQFRPPVGRFVIEVPAGLRDREESLVETARRELVEETGWMSDNLEELAEGPVSAGMSSEHLTVFLARDVVPASEELRRLHRRDAMERIETIVAPLDNIHTCLAEFQHRGDYVDLKLYGLIELARRIL